MYLVRIPFCKTPLGSLWQVRKITNRSATVSHRQRSVWAHRHHWFHSELRRDLLFFISSQWFLPVFGDNCFGVHEPPPWRTHVCRKKYNRANSAVGTNTPDLCVYYTSITVYLYVHIIHLHLLCSYQQYGRKAPQCTCSAKTKISESVQPKSSSNKALEHAALKCTRWSAMTKQQCYDYTPGPSNFVYMFNIGIKPSIHTLCISTNQQFSKTSQPGRTTPHISTNKSDKNQS